MSARATFRDCFHVQRFIDASFFATELFFEAFASAFPAPVETPAIGLREPITQQDWSQYVAFYRWPDGRFEPVGFVNYIRYGPVYLEGGLCTKRDLYRRLPDEHRRECDTLGRVAHLLMEHVATELSDRDAWFAYIGDARSAQVCARVGYQIVRPPYLVAKWFRELSTPQREALIERVAAIGPF